MVVGEGQAEMKGHYHTVGGRTERNRDLIYRGVLSR